MANFAPVHPGERRLITAYEMTAMLEAGAHVRRWGRPHTPAIQPVAGGGTIEVRYGLLVGKTDEDRKIGAGEWEKATDKRRLKPPARDLKDPAPEDPEEDLYHPPWTHEVHALSIDEEGYYVQQFTEQPLPGEEEEEDPETEMVPSTFRATYIGPGGEVDDEVVAVTIPKAAKSMTQNFNEVTHVWEDKPDAEQEVYALFCRVENGEIKFIDECHKLKILRDPPPVPEEP